MKKKEKTIGEEFQDFLQRAMSQKFEKSSKVKKNNKNENKEREKRNF